VGRFVLTGNNAANTGNVLNVLSSGANTLAKAINVSVASTGNLATGAVRFNFSGAHTGTGFQVDDATVAGVGMRVNVAALTTGTGFQVLGNAVTSGDLLNVGTNSSGNFTGNGAIDFGAAGSHTGTFFTVRDVANDHDGNVMRIDSSGDIGTVLGIVSNRTTTGTLLSVTTNSLALNSTLGVINVANTGAPTGILARFQSNSTAGSGMTILANGNTGIATVAPAVLFHTGSAAIVSGTTVARFENAGGTCDVTPNIAGGITCTSDERFKTNIQEFTVINGGTYQVGVIAQGLEQILPDLVRTNEEGYMSVSYSGLTPYLVQAVQEQQVLIDSKSNQEEVDIIVAEVNGEVTNLQGNFAGLQDTLDTFQNQFSELQNDDIAQLQTSIIDLQSYDQSTALQLEELTTKYSDLELEIVQINLTTAGLTLNLNALEGRVAGLESTAFANHTESGKATAIVGEAHIEVLFTVPFITEPIVNLTPLSNMNGILYWVEETSTNGFTIKFSEPIITLEHKFNWSAQ